MAEELLHVTTRAAWDQRGDGATYAPPGLAEEGFVHLCTAAQLPGVLARHYAGATGLVVLRLDLGPLPEVRWEPGAGSDPGPFPHAYGPLPVSAVRAVDDVVVTAS